MWNIEYQIACFRASIPRTDAARQLWNVMGTLIKRTEESRTHARNNGAEPRKDQEGSRQHIGAP